MTHPALPAFPHGWFAVALAHEVAAGAVVARRLCGHDIVVWRTAGGQVRVNDAYCMHLGAHLGVGGWVNGQSIVCPFHGWEYDGSGRCVRIPYEKRPMRVTVAPWHVREQDEAVLVWFHPEGLPPTSEVPALEWTGFAHRSREWTVRSHPQEICENTADGAHFRYIHKFPNVMDVAAREDGDSIWFDLRIRDGEVGERAAGEPVPFEITGRADSNVTAVHGPGMAFNETRAKGRILRNRLYATPTDEGVVRLIGVHSVAFEDGRDPEEHIERTMGWAAFDAWEDDIPIWENKIYRPKPFATHPSEEALVQFRRWYQRWYADAAPDRAGAR
ncbi:Rieske 2Fe-2S domain-containing protein [Pseudonocardia abyssalis]|uniref:Rieske-type oxygenase n=1 Tax=Pseudonocardia abyssalis TaxID=2792008 RepID=A0ABS6UR63_9PSEU|nr:Rieske 2Fe-2S domain-containing protein [Pseudonocardia abyssalis]MBW0134752.1 Rieske 2Fe-2S domain-containing protein [Pseudonocardia abyssalis]